MLSQEEQKYANVFIHDVQAGNVTLEPHKTFRDYISELMKAAENHRIRRVVQRLGCYEKLLREMLERKVTKETIEDHGRFAELKESVDKQKAIKFFVTVEKNRFEQSRLAMYIDRYLRFFLLTGGDDPYPEQKDILKSEKTKSENNENIYAGVVLTDTDMVGKTSVSVVKKSTLSEWYSESKALACVMDTGCFAYMDNKLCVYDKKYIERDKEGRMFFTKYALDHKEECFLQFVIDNKTGKLHYVTLPESMASKSFKYADEITEDMATKLGLVNEISTEMLTAIKGCDFGEALTKLLSKNICGYSAGLLQSTTGLDKRTQSNMRKSENLTKSNVVTACLGIHVPFPVSNRMLELAELPLKLDLPKKQGEENRVYDSSLHLMWAWDYSDTYDELKDQGYEYLIHTPPM